MLCQLVDASLDALGIRSWNGRKCFSRLVGDLDAVDQGRFNAALTSSQGIAPCKRTSSRAAAAAATSSASSNRCTASSASRETSAAKGVPGRLRVRRSAAKIVACRATGYNITKGHARKLVKIGDRGTRDIFAGLATAEARRTLPRELHEKAARLLDRLKAAGAPSDLRTPRGNRLEMLAGDRANRYSIRINDQYRICFVWEHGEALDVIIAEYHR